MFRILLTITVIGSIFLIYKTCKRTKMTSADLWPISREEFLILKKLNNIPEGGFLIIFRKICYLLTLSFFLILAVSAYLQILIAGGPLSGWLLIIHVTVAPFFVTGVMLSILIMAQQQRFKQQDWLYLKQIAGQKRVLLQRREDTKFWDKLLFWIFMLAVIPAILSVLLQLYPVFGSSGMETLLEIHRYSTLILFIAVIAHGRLLLLRLNN